MFPSSLQYDCRPRALCDSLLLGLQIPWKVTCCWTASIKGTAGQGMAVVIGAIRDWASLHRAIKAFLDVCRYLNVAHFSAKGTLRG